MVDHHTLQGVAPRAMRGIMAALVLLASVVTVPAGALAAAAPAPFAFADNNNNGVYDAGDQDITEQLSAGHFMTGQSVVLPDKMKQIKTKHEFGITLFAGKNIYVGGDLNAAGHVTGLSITSETGHITVGSSARLKGNSGVTIMALAGDLTIGAGASISGTHGREGTVYLYAEGHLVVGTKAQLNGPYSIDLVSNGGTVTVWESVNFAAGGGKLDIQALGDITVNDCKIKASETSVSTMGHFISFRNNRVSSPRDGWLDLFAAGSTIDVTGSDWKNIAPDHVTIHAQNVIGR